MQTVAPTLLLATKLYVPQAPGRLVPRPRLSERLDRGGATKLLLVSAPAGFGKSTLLAEWLATGSAATGRTTTRRVAWVSLDRGDNHPGTFWTYVVAALQTIAPEVGATARVLLQAAEPAAITAALTTLLNDLAAAADDLVLVLDDYHVIDSPEIQEGMAFLLDHLPPSVHLVVAGRADPALPLARLRSRGELVEVRAADLRFTAEEAVAYLNGVMGLDLTETDVAALEGRTEGWIAALQLAALSIQGRVDATDFIADFAGDARYVVDYLIEEVLARQPERVQSFLLQTAILERLTGPLCDAVTGGDGGKPMLEALERSNLFLVPLDDRRRWYRYHHLFADVLRARLLDEHPELLPTLHRRACDWYEANGERAVAIAHAFAAEDFDRAAELVELAGPAMRRDRQEARLRRWMEALPDDVIRDRPMLSNGYVGSLMATGEFEGIEPHLREAERWLEAMAGRPQGDRPPGMVVVDEEGFRGLPTTVAVHRAGQALGLGDRAGTIMYARRALDLADADDHIGRAAAAALIGLALWGDGDLAGAHAGYAEAMDRMRRAGYIADIHGLAITMADIRIVQGRLGDAMRTYEDAFRLGTLPDQPPLRGTADMFVGMAAVHRERNDLPAATRLLLQSQEQGEHLGLPQNPHRWRVAMARLREAEGDLDAAVDLFDDAERVYAGDFSPNVRPIPAMRARVWLAQGKRDDALRWAREQSLSVDDDLTYLHEFEHVTLARVLLAQHRDDRAATAGARALELLRRLLHAAEDGERTGTVLEILVLEALLHQAAGNTSAALASLERSLVLAEPEGYVRIFLDEGRPMTALLRAAVGRGSTSDYAQRLLAGAEEPRPRATASPGLVQPLSDRELDVLRLLRTDLGGPEIARELVVSLNTVRTHTKNIYAKLGVNNRRAAITRAADLGLLDAHGSRHHPA